MGDRTMTTDTNHVQLLLTARDAAKALAISERTLWTLTNRGDVPVVRLGRSVRYDPDDLRAFVKRSKTSDWS
jgi:excisionase family DNA binding protein